jgi:hypothetical protein
LKDVPRIDFTVRRCAFLASAAAALFGASTPFARLSIRITGSGLYGKSTCCIILREKYRRWPE